MFITFNSPIPEYDEQHTQVSLATLAQVWQNGGQFPLKDDINPYTTSSCWDDKLHRLRNNEYFSAFSWVRLPTKP